MTHDLARALAEGFSAGHADDDLVGEPIGLYDSDTGVSLMIEKRVVLPTDDGPVSLVYTTAKRGRICQVRRFNLHIHYFIDEDGTMISDDARRHGVTREQMLEHGIETFACAKCSNSEPRRCETSECDLDGSCIACGAISGEICQDQGES